MNKRMFLLRRIGRVLWLRATIFCLIALAAALFAYLIGEFVPRSLVAFVGKKAIEDLLSIISSSMLAVTTFSLATMVAATSAVTSNTSPRAATLLLEDSRALNALSTFIAAFIFSIVGLIVLSTEFYSDAARFVLFLETLIVIGFVVMRLLAWIDQLAKIGRVSHVIDRVEQATFKALDQRRSFLGGLPAVPVPEEAEAIFSERVGYIEHIDVPRLQGIAEENHLKIHLNIMPGSFVRKSRPLVHVEGKGGELAAECRKRIVEALVIGDSRTFEQDPRFGLVVLAEIAARALSPAVNDPGTAIDVIGTAVRILDSWADEHWGHQAKEKCPNVYVPSVEPTDIFHDVFRPIARDGAGMVEVGIALQKAMDDLSRRDIVEWREAAHTQSRDALARAEKALHHGPDLEAVRQAAPQRHDPGDRPAERSV